MARLTALLLVSFMAAALTGRAAPAPSGSAEPPKPCQGPINAVADDRAGLVVHVQCDPTEWPMLVRKDLKEVWLGPKRIKPEELKCLTGSTVTIQWSPHGRGKWKGEATGVRGAPK